MPDSLKLISEEVRTCKKCPLYKHATHGVPGEGPKDAKIFFIGQSPGRMEDQTGKPFVGRAGRYLTKMIGSIGLKREEIFITSIVKHYPPENRAPKPNEITACKPYLLRQLAIINPKIVVLLGKTAETLRNEPVLKDKKVITTVHPAAAMRFPKMKKRMQRDFKALKKLVWA
ncbi:uracil-DNA glycosylase [Candidatus Woesearchaeota archaeon]|nr:uracil-DNA glycosylase [Candidatus Woesearchaeota archaeon]